MKRVQRILQNFSICASLLLMTIVVPLLAQSQAPAGGKTGGLGPVDALGQQVQRPPAPTGLMKI